MKYTIIITVYNKQEYIERSLKSALNQTYKNYEVLVVNDGSTDGSEKIIKKFLKKYDFKYYKKENSGVSATRNFAISKVTTDYFLFLDADDYIALDLLEKVSAYYDYDLLSFNLVQVDESDNYIRTINKINFNGSGADYFKKLVYSKSEFTFSCGYIYRKGIFIENNLLYPSSMILEDFYLTPFIIINCDKVISIDFLGYYYLKNNNSITNDISNRKKIIDTYFKYYDMMLDRIKYDGNYNVVSKTFKLFLANVLIWYGSTLDTCEQKRYVKLLNQKNVVKYITPFFKKAIVCILLKFNMYYFVRDLFKRLQ